ncbi:MAG: hypothetical protein ACXV3D_06430, partial [Halobacteriota archaeon]
DVFDKLGIEEEFKTTIIDDCVVTKSVKKANYSIYFEPKCIMESPPETSMSSFVGFGARQFTWFRWYFPMLWLAVFVGFVGAPLIALGLLILLLSGNYIAGISLGVLILFEMLCGWLGIYLLPKRMVYPKERYSSKIGYGLMTPLAFLLVAQSVIVSAVAQEIQWAGRTYRKPKNQW